MSITSGIYFDPKVRKFQEKEASIAIKNDKRYKKKFNKEHNLDWVDASSSAANIFDLNEITIEDKS